MVSAARAYPPFEELYRRIVELPEGVTGEILERGTLETMGRPGRDHRAAARRAGRSLDEFDENVGGSGWWIEVEAEVRLLRDYLTVPDLAGWRTERVQTLPNENPISIVPDWVCEILSPSTRRTDRSRKLPLYARAEVPWIWLLDTEAKTVEVFESVNARATLGMVETTCVALPPFDRVFDVAAWFAAPAARKTHRASRAVDSATASKRGKRKSASRR
ncbi:MAG TPA: Uma2 family endonuclease [Labilithrix sp.]|jgi:Uma2 family endonuclease|nr:Uma2 family endonuclease [Labilithrix sp.]